MRMADCAREREVVTAALDGRFDGELQSHVEGCASCRDVAAVTTALRDDRELARAGLPVPAAGQVWWRAAVRARLEATQAAARPLTWAQGIAGACAAGLTATAAGVAWPKFAQAGAWVAERLRDVVPAAVERTDPASLILHVGVPLAFVLGACLVLAPLALYLALTNE